jgi:hypothetical protein
LYFIIVFLSFALGKLDQAFEVGGDAEFSSTLQLLLHSAETREAKYTVTSQQEMCRRLIAGS